MTDEVVCVWKVPKMDEEFDSGEWDEIGIFPSGELMAICESEDAAMEVVEHLRLKSPSSRFGDSMEDAPYTFTLSDRDVWDEDYIDVND